MRRMPCLCFYSLGVALLAMMSGCASQGQPRNGPLSEPGRAQEKVSVVNGMVSNIDGDALTIVGVTTKTAIMVTETTRYYLTSSASLADISTGSWLILRGRNDGSGKAIAESIRISSSKPAESESMGSDQNAMGNDARNAPPGGNPGNPPNGNGHGAPPEGGGGNGPRQGSQGQGIEYVGEVKGISGNKIILSVSEFGKAKEVAVLTDSKTECVKIREASKDDLRVKSSVSANCVRRNGSLLEVIAIDIKR
jgi:hypothetical protein